MEIVQLTDYWGGIPVIDRLNVPGEPMLAGPPGWPPEPLWQLKVQYTRCLELWMACSIRGGAFYRSTNVSTQALHSNSVFLCYF
jgi:hypothetical protein